MNAELNKNRDKISLAIIDSFYELQTKRVDFMDKELFEIQLMKVGLELSEELTIFFENFISTQKTNEETDYYSKIITEGLKTKYNLFNKKCGVSSD